MKVGWPSRLQLKKLRIATATMGMSEKTSRPIKLGSMNAYAWNWRSLKRRSFLLRGAVMAATPTAFRLAPVASRLSFCICQTPPLKVGMHDEKYRSGTFLQRHERHQREIVQ